MAYTFNIVQVNVSQQSPPIPSQLQRTVAFLSQGATTTTPGTLTPLVSLSSLTSILTGAKAITSMVFSTGTVTVTTTSPHGFTVSDTIPLTISGVLPSAYNGTFTCTITGASTFTYPLAGSPGSVTQQGTYTEEDVAELTQMNATFFAQGNAAAANVLELGPGNATDGCAYLTTWIAGNPGIVYIYLVPRLWNGVTAYLTLVAGFESPTAKTYFFTTTTSGTYTDYTSTMKSVLALIESPSVPATEFSLASYLYNAAAYNPPTPVGPFAFKFVYGVTQFPVAGNQAELVTWENYGTNVIGNASEGGIATAAQWWGTTQDGQDFSYWYSVDWVQINAQLELANDVYNGSNNLINPLLYNQQGINVLQASLAQMMGSAITYGLAVGTVIQTELDPTTFQLNLDNGLYAGNIVINAVPFTVYNTLNPNDYAIGKYAGLSIVYTPARGFRQIIVNIVVTDFLAT